MKLLNEQAVASFTAGGRVVSNALSRPASDGSSSCCTVAGAMQIFLVYGGDAAGWALCLLITQFVMYLCGMQAPSLRSVEQS